MNSQTTGIATAVIVSVALNKGMNYGIGVSMTAGAVLGFAVYSYSAMSQTSPFVDQTQTNTKPLVRESSKPAVPPAPVHNTDPFDAYMFG